MIEERKLLERKLIQNQPIELSESATSVVNQLEARLSPKEMPKLLYPGRRINNFCIGSDPEFCFVGPGDTKKTPAQALGLYPGVAFGCDQNQRLAELRGWPTTSAVEHVAGILSSLRWMVRRVPTTLDFEWRAGAAFQGDGIGGHIHFGRKRPTREQEVSGLDGLAKMFRHLQFFNNAEWDTRLEPDAHNNHGYGFYGDIRAQRHGYEYRTLPSWLCSPLKAFVVVAVAKLAVLDPELTKDWGSRGTKELDLPKKLALIQRLARYYSGRDDDALLLSYVLTKPDFLQTCQTWQTTSRDFKQSWGFELPGKIKGETFVLPQVIAPDVSEITEIEDHLLQAKPLQFRAVTPTFRFELPKHYRQALTNFGNAGLQWAGVGDLLSAIATSDHAPIDIRFDKYWSVGSHWVQRMPKETFRETQKAVGGALHVDYNRPFSLVISRDYLSPQRMDITKGILIDSGAFPIWKIADVQEASVYKFIEMIPKSPSWKERTL